MKNKHIGENIRMYRVRKDLTQRELGDKIGKTWEMISRYETGKSSPMNQLTKLADVLDIHPTDLLRDNQQEVIYSSNRIPLFTSIPENGDFVKGKTYTFYPAPDWVKDIDMDVFAVDMSIVDGSHGCIFVSTKADIKSGDKVLTYTDGNLEIVVHRGNTIGLVGKVLAQEVRFV